MHSSSFPVYDSAQRRPLWVEEFTALFRQRELIVQLVGRNIKTRYKRSVLGVAWTMLNPLLMTVILSVVFSEMMKFPIRYYAVYVFSGLLAWNFFSQTTISAMSELSWGGNLANRIYVPRSIFAATALGTGLVNLTLALPPVLLLMLVLGMPFTPALLFLPVSILIVALFSFGVGLILSALFMQFTDVMEMFQILLSALYFFTPIMYPLAYISDSYRWAFRLNPIHYIIEVFRRPIYEGRLPSARHIAAAVLLTLVTTLFGWWFFTRRANQLAHRA
ncbi:MAG TPA: ABC transporter permease [Blastocatellia bacterium]|nr:ABC transporter permease [Blastocatellia bacterium]